MNSSVRLVLPLALLAAAVAGLALPRSRLVTTQRQKRNTDHIIRDCMLVTSEPGHYFYKSVGDDPTVCGVYIMTDPDKIVQLQFDYLDLPCNTGGLVSFVDGWELNGGYFPEVGEHRLRLEDRVTEFCGLNRPGRAFISSQNAALVQYRVPKRARGFSFRVTFLKNPTHDPQLPDKSSEESEKEIEIPGKPPMPSTPTEPTKDQAIAEENEADSEVSQSSSHPGFVVRTDVIRADEFRQGYGGSSGALPCGSYGGRIQRSCGPGLSAFGPSGGSFGGYSPGIGGGQGGFTQSGNGFQGGFGTGGGFSSGSGGSQGGFGQGGGFGPGGSGIQGGFGTGGSGIQGGFGSGGGGQGGFGSGGGGGQGGFGSGGGGGQGGFALSGLGGGGISSSGGGCCPNSNVPQGFSPPLGVNQGGCCSNPSVPQSFSPQPSGNQGGCCSNSGGFGGVHQSGFGGTQSGGYPGGSSGGVLTGNNGWSHRPTLSGNSPGPSSGGPGLTAPGIQGSFPPVNGVQNGGGDFPGGGFPDGGLDGGQGCPVPNICGDSKPGFPDKNKSKGNKYETKETKVMSTSELQRVVLIEQLKATRLLKDYYNQLLGKNDPIIP